MWAYLRNLKSFWTYLQRFTTKPDETDLDLLDTLLQQIRTERKLNGLCCKLSISHVWLTLSSGYKSLKNKQTIQLNRVLSNNTNNILLFK